MDLELVKESYQNYCIENKIRKRLIESLLKNDQDGVVRNQRRYIKLVNITNNSLTEVLPKTPFYEIDNGIKQTINNPEYRELTGFLLLLLSYNQLSYANNNGNKFSEHNDALYFKLVKWYVDNHYISDKERDNLIKEITETTSSSVAVRNILSDREKINDSVVTLNIRNELEGKFLFKKFLDEINIFVLLSNVVLLKQCISFGDSIPKTLILRLVLLNLITKEFSIGFSIEEYINNYYQQHDVMKEVLNFPFPAGNSILKMHVDDLLLEVNNITNEFLNQKKK